MPDHSAAILDEFDDYLALQCGRSVHTRRAYLGDLRSLFAFLADRAAGLEALSLPVLRSWLAVAAGSGAARTTLARRTSAVKAFTAWAARRGLLSADPAVRLQAPKAHRILPSVLRQDQALEAMSAARSGAEQGDPLALRDRLIVELLYASGIRVSELCGLDVDDIDAGHRLLRVLGKGNKQRTAPYGEPAAEALRVWLADGRPELVTAESGPAPAARGTWPAAQRTAGPHRGAPDRGRRRRRTRHGATRTATQRGYPSP